MTSQRSLPTDPRQLPIGSAGWQACFLFPHARGSTLTQRWLFRPVSPFRHTPVQMHKRFCSRRICELIPQSPAWRRSGPHGLAFFSQYMLLLCLGTTKIMESDTILGDSNVEFPCYLLKCELNILILSSIYDIISSVLKCMWPC